MGDQRWFISPTNFPVEFFESNSCNGEMHFKHSPPQAPFKDRARRMCKTNSILRVFLDSWCNRQIIVFQYFWRKAHDQNETSDYMTSTMFKSFCWYFTYLYNIGLVFSCFHPARQCHPLAKWCTWCTVPHVPNVCSLFHYFICSLRCWIVAQQSCTVTGSKVVLYIQWRNVSYLHYLKE